MKLIRSAEYKVIVRNFDSYTLYWHSCTHDANIIVVKIKDASYSFKELS